MGLGGDCSGGWIACVGGGEMRKASRKAKRQARQKPKRRMPHLESTLEQNAKLYVIVRMAQIALDVLGIPSSSLPPDIVGPEGVERRD
jgi:hypothetical protein